MPWDSSRVSWEWCRVLGPLKVGSPKTDGTRITYENAWYNLMNINIHAESEHTFKGLHMQGRSVVEQ